MGKFSFKDKLKEEVVFDSGIRGKRILLYGCNDTGKTFQACHFPHPFLIETEAGGSGVNCPKEDCTERWSKFTDIVDDLVKNADDYKDELQTVIIDTAENLVKLSERAVCNTFGVRDLSEITGKQNGYNICRTDFQLQINRLTAKRYAVIFIAHEETIDMTDEVTGETYKFIQPKGTSNEKSSMRMLRDLCDYCIYCRPNGIDKETYETINSTAICKRTKNVFARSRFAIKTIVNPFTAENLILAIEDSVKKSAEQEGAKVGEIKETEKYTKKDYLEIIKPYVTKLWGVCQDDVTQIIECELGEGRKVSDATDDELVALDNIYNNLVTKATLLGIDV